MSSLLFTMFYMDSSVGIFSSITGNDTSMITSKSLHGTCSKTTSIDLQLPTIPFKVRLPDGDIESGRLNCSQYARYCPILITDIRFAQVSILRMSKWWSCGPSIDINAEIFWSWFLPSTRPCKYYDMANMFSITPAFSFAMKGVSSSFGSSSAHSTQSVLSPVWW